MKDFSIFLGGFLLGFLLTPVAGQLSLRYRILDYPESRKMHDRPTPLLGGVAIYVSFLIIHCFFFPPYHPFFGVLLGSTVIFFISLVNDIHELSAITRLAYQLIGAIIMVAFGVRISFLPPTLLGDVSEVFLTLLWIVGITNAMNFLDGLDGLLSGLCVITGIFFYVVARQVHEPYFGLLTLAMSGIALGFLPHNFPIPWIYLKRLLQGKKLRPIEGRAKIFLGDNGATFLGAFFAGISVMGDLATHNVIALTVPLLLLGIPIFDITFITIRRILERRISNLGEWLNYAGKDHFHHRLVDLGFTRGGAVFFIYCVALTLGITAIVIRNVQPFEAFLVLLKASLIFLLIALLMITGIRSSSNGGQKK